eukprot:747415-Hanusia_phi.AAC.1
MAISTSSHHELLVSRRNSSQTAVPHQEGSPDLKPHRPRPLCSALHSPPGPPPSSPALDMDPPCRGACNKFASDL